MPRHVCIHTKTHTRTHLLLSQLTAVCVCVWLCRLSATDRFIVAEQQRLVLHSLKESVFSPGEFNQSGGGGFQTASSLSHIHTHTQFNFLNTQNHHTAIFKKKKSKQTYSSEKQTLLHVRKTERRVEGIPCLSDCIWICCGQNKFVLSVKPHGGNPGARTAVSTITCSHSHKHDLQPSIYTVSLTGTFPNNNRWSLIHWKQNTTLLLRDCAHSLLFLCLGHFLRVIDFPSLHLHLPPCLTPFSPPWTQNWERDCEKDKVVKSC